MHRSAVGVLILAAIVSSAEARPEEVETFSSGNPYGWTFGPPGVIEQTGGNPGQYLHVTFLDTFAPQARCAMNVGAPFTGDLRARRVEGLGIDLVLFAVDFTAEGRPLSLLLISDNGTPGDGLDDWAMYFIGDENVPLVGEGWKSFDFAVPSGATSAPAGWQFIQFGPNSPASGDWNALMQDVSQVLFFYGDPTLFFIFQGWNVGMDNPRVRTRCLGDVDGDDEVGFGDLNLLLGNYGLSGEGLAGDINGDGEVGFEDLNLLLGVYGAPCG